MLTDGCDQFVLVGEVVIRGRVADPGPTRDLPQREALRPEVVGDLAPRVEERVAEVTVVVSRSRFGS